MLDSKSNYWIATEEGLCKLVVSEKNGKEEFKFKTFSTTLLMLTR